MPWREITCYHYFSFTIKLDDQMHMEGRLLSLCVSYSVDDCDFWGNGNTVNYRVYFKTR